MQFQSRLRRTVWFSFVLGLIPDSLIAAALAWFTGSGITGIALFLLAIQLLYLVIWIKNAAWTWCTFAAFGRKQIASILLDGLRSQKFPEPNDQQRSVEGFFQEIARDVAQPIAVRMAAATELGALNYPIRQGRLLEALRISMAYEDALIAYKGTFSAQTRLG